MTKAQPVIGRERETSALRDAVGHVDSGGSAFVIDGEAGIGKSSLVADVLEHASRRGLRTLTTTGTLAESAEPYSALHMLLYPLRGGIANLPSPQRRALDVAFGVATGIQPSPLLAGLAALTLLSDAAAERPLLIVAEDLHWMDAPSEWALRMMARRVGEDPVVIVMTTRNTDAVENPGIRRLHLRPLDQSAADELLDGVPGAPTGQARRDLVLRAEGNPLALHELGRSTAAAERTRERPVVGRVEQEFADRYTELDQGVRLAILAVALSGGTVAEEAARVAARAIGRFPTPTWTEQASAASLLEWVAPRAIRFRHPLVQSAVLSVTSPPERTAVLRSLVLEHQDDPARTIWWRAELATGHDDPLADEIAALGDERTAMSDTFVASRAYERAAELTSDVARRVERRIVAAELAGLSGRTSDASLLVQRARDEAPPGLLAARAAWVAETLPTGRTGLAVGDLGPALHAVSEMQLAGGVEHATAALLHLAAIAWDHTAEADPGDPMLVVVEALALPEDDPRSILLAARTEPLARGDRVLELALAAAPAALDEETAWLLGYALNLVGEIDTARVLLDRALASMQTRGELRTFPQALMGTSMTTYLAGDVARARALAQQAASLGRDLGDAGFSAAARCALAWFDALEGEQPDTERIAGGTEAGAQVLRSSAMRATLLGATGLAHLISGRAADALEPLRRLFDPDDDAFNPTFAVLTSHDYVDAALESGNRPDAEQRLADLEWLHERWHAPLVRTAVHSARTALLSDDDLESAWATLQHDRWPVPYVQARALLRLGRRLRRAGRSTTARAVLHAALDLFEAMPAPIWAERTRDAIRATGERLPTTGQRSIDLLTPQELRVCTLAAQGLSNRAIGEHLFVSPRTVGAHLYAAFQKLGISTRQQLPSVLTPGATAADD
ncbi:regulatory LuxR family protein [Curtobacterium sp. PhB172]|uniref:helix-turn-helix transcriptional regulator n=1 Tax=unclassified Curtobacterium TaxID=257496 RepID=UPI000F469F7E|nr:MULTISPECIES: LuxR family transcriptional regulator [unclassified Curtobacterium]ROQ03929.1 regulatory LuxR family protein [Curtobacterium sp. PhB171]ROQ19024.1 regulatory LuxR family protein [Curtobacterium sp. PhB170]ROS32569.1 regulatory LuxR family protein [Curtobacterium sp. PhB131]ROS58686.1 regulatory LuxR family protein [Curtobacterium sp. PhB172]ROS63663.1 regulatory LuxR family protein [Curtobacterium sp. PhB141]